ncbi:MAG: hypothetical protein KDH88_01460 [Chromatiales bacterium]|nr:hypothetical protein [Chromatiales bacterium]
MKITITADVTPDELRAFFGLPDVTPLHQELVEQIRKNMEAGAHGFDPLSLMKPLLPTNFQSPEAWQKYWNAVAAGMAGKSTKTEE